MPALNDLSGQLALYKSYHWNKVNVAIHLVCIPIIFVTILAAVSPVNLAGSEHPYVNLSLLTAIIYGAYYIYLDYRVGIPTALAIFALTFYIKSYVLLLTPAELTHFRNVMLLIHVGSWLAQFYGHGVHEKRAPALLDNLVQALVLAPYFVVFEGAFFFGCRRGLEKQMLNEAGVLRRDYIQQLKKAQ